ncbi:MAG TPA: DUF4832 domain-containing protein [Bryobacteraceae bacterium]|jgi:hypothetical protein|nr:DUF4832 domain-containing protein [Bryobacteraceae bacterium]
MKRTPIPLLFLSIFCPSQLPGEKIIVYPAERHEILVNPGMGIQTFQRYNGDALNPGVKWSEEGPLGPLTAPAVAPRFPQSTVSYCRWHWSVIEPEHGKIRWEILDTALAEARRHGQTLAIRLMPYDPKHPLPEWYRKSGARRANSDNSKDGKIWHPDFSDPLYYRYWTELITAVGKRYDGHPDLDSVDISTVGFWGEGWSDYMPAFPVQKALIDVYFDAFKRTPLIMNFDQPEALSYGTTRGAGWRFDCLGDLRAKWSHMRDFYPEQIARTGIRDIWRKAPVSMEACGVPESWKRSGWDVNYILAEALRWHVSTLNVKSTAIPAEWESQFNDFQKKMGYRFALRRAEWESPAVAGHMMPFSSWWVNEGVAPVYRPYVLAFALHSEKAGAVIRTGADIRTWLPGDAVFEDSLAIPPDLPAGSYELRVAMLDPRTLRPAIHLAVAGENGDGWTALGKVEIVGAEEKNQAIAAVAPRHD